MLDSRILQIFEVEATEHLQSLNADLLDLERDDGAREQRRTSILRAAHTLKGSAAAAGVPRVEQLAHAFESCMHALDRDGVDLSTAVDLLCRLLDAAEAEVHFACSGHRPSMPTALPTDDELARVFGNGLGVKLGTTMLAPEPARGIAEHGARATEGATVRVATGKVDRLMASIEDLVHVRAGGSERERDLTRIAAALEGMSRRMARMLQRQRAQTALGGASEQLAPELREIKDQLQEAALLGTQLGADLRRHSHALTGLATRLQDDIRSMRMVPANVVFAGFARLIRDVARHQGKRVQLRIEGGDTEVDRDLLETLKDPVMHLLRNAVAHGVEAPALREQLGKAPEGIVQLSVRGSAAGLELIVEDDGRGIDAAAIRRALVARGTHPQDEVDAMSEADLLPCIFRPGFSTAVTIDEISGRGVGLDVVHSSVEGCGGSVHVASQLGTSTRFTLKLPLNLTTVRALLVRVAGQTVAIPASGVARIVRVDRSAVRVLNAGPAIELDGRAVPLARLSAVLRLGDEASSVERAPAVIVGSSNERVGLLVDTVDGEDELIVKSLGEYLGEVPFVVGGAMLASGKLAPVLSVSALVRQLVTAQGAQQVFAPARAAQAARKRVLIVDDSITTRTLEKSILEAVGYDVTVATDGQDALGKLRNASFDLILSDVQMPRMDGIELVTRVRRDDKLRSIKVVLVSSLSTDEDRRRGLTAGADAYIGKQEFRQDLLLETLGRLI